MGMDGVETDIRAARDGVLVLLHDATVDRTTDGSRAVAELTWAVGARWTPGLRFQDGQHAFGPQRVPPLEDFLDRYGGRTTFRLELKARESRSALRQVRARRMMEQVVFTSPSRPRSIGAIRVAARRPRRRSCPARTPSTAP